MNIPVTVGPIEIMALVGMFLYGTCVVWVVRNVYKDMRDDRQSDYETY